MIRRPGMSDLEVGGQPPAAVERTAVGFTLLEAVIHRVDAQPASTRPSDAAATR